MSDEALADASAIDSAEAMREFMAEVVERAKQFPRSCLERRHPHVAAKALWLLAQGAPIKEIARITKIGHMGIRSLEWRHNDTLETKRKEFSQKYAMAAAEFTDLLFEKAERLANNPDELAKISPEKLALTVGIMTDKAAQLSGMASVTVEHRRGPSIDDAAKVIEEARMRIANKVRSEAVDAELA